MTNALGALAVSFGKGPLGGYYNPPYCILIGVEILPQTVLRTRNTFFTPWVTFTSESDPQKVMESCEISRKKSPSNPSKARKLYLTCDLKTASSVTGPWYDIRLSTHEEPQGRA